MYCTLRQVEALTSLPHGFSVDRDHGKDAPLAGSTGPHVEWTSCVSVTRANKSQWSEIGMFCNKPGSCQMRQRTSGRDTIISPVWRGVVALNARKAVHSLPQDRLDDTIIATFVSTKKSITPVKGAGTLIPRYLP